MRLRRYGEKIDSERNQSWQEATAPFDGITLYSPFLTLPGLRQLLVPIVEILHNDASSSETRLWRLEDWHEHDGIVNRGITTTWADVWALLASDDALLGACTDEHFVRTAFYDDNRRFLFRVYIPPKSGNPFHAYNDPNFVTYGEFDLTSEEWLTDCARAASLAVDADAGLKTKNAKAYFDKAYTCGHGSD